MFPTTKQIVSRATTTGREGPFFGCCDSQIGAVLALSGQMNWHNSLIFRFILISKRGYRSRPGWPIQTSFRGVENSGWAVETCVVPSEGGNSSFTVNWDVALWMDQFLTKESSMSPILSKKVPRHICIILTEAKFSSVCIFKENLNVGTFSANG